jgi:hypothetical protein
MAQEETNRPDDEPTDGLQDGPDAPDDKEIDDGCGGGDNEQDNP